jgi:hypothetical protein
VPADPNNGLKDLSQTKRTEGEGSGLFDLITRSLASSGHVCVSFEPLAELDNAVGGKKKGSGGGEKGSGSLEKAAASAMASPETPEASEKGEEGPILLLFRPLFVDRLLSCLRLHNGPASASTGRVSARFKYQ